MGLLDGKNALVFGVANDHSIAWGIAKALHEHGADGRVQLRGEPLERRVRPLAASIGSTFVEPCDVRDDAALKAVFDRWGAEVGGLDILVHALALANREDLEGAFVDTSRDGFALALDVSAYSLVALAREARPHLRPGASILTLSYYGAEKVVAHYNVMGVAKAALEACVRYLAADLGPSGVRVNAISAGPRPDPRGARDRQLQDDVRVVPRRGAAPFEHHDRGRRRNGRLAGERPLPAGDRRGRPRRRRLQRHGRADPRGLTVRQRRRLRGAPAAAIAPAQCHGRRPLPVGR